MGRGGRGPGGVGGGVPGEGKKVQSHRTGGTRPPGRASVDTSFLRSARPELRAWRGMDRQESHADARPLQRTKAWLATAPVCKFVLEPAYACAIDSGTNLHTDRKSTRLNSSHT